MQRRKATGDKAYTPLSMASDTVPHRVSAPYTEGGQSYLCDSADECQNWANSHTPKPEGVSHDSRRSACASVASVWGSQHVMAKVTCPPTVHGPLGWVVACATWQGQCVRPAAPPRAPDRSQRLVPVPPLAGGCCVRGWLSSTGVRHHAVSARFRARRLPHRLRLHLHIFIGGRVD